MSNLRQAARGSAAARMSWRASIVRVDGGVLSLVAFLGLDTVLRLKEVVLSWLEYWTPVRTVLPHNFL
jgi:hypothetical protein